MHPQIAALKTNIISSGDFYCIIKRYQMFAESQVALEDSINYVGIDADLAPRNVKCSLREYHAQISFNFMVYALLTGFTNGHIRVH